MGVRRWRPDARIVDFAIFSHVDHELVPENTLAEAERWAAGIGGPAYAVDDQTAIVVTDGHHEVVSEGTGGTTPDHARRAEPSGRPPAARFRRAPA